MKHLSLLFFLFTFLSLNYSCKKESDSQLLSKKLQTIIKTENVERVIAGTENTTSEYTEIYGNYGLDYKFDAPLIRIEDKSYNLISLKRYQLMIISTHKCLVLIF